MNDGCFDCFLLCSDAVQNKEPDENKDVEISKNAQFRAIQPSPSILSFVEENVI